MASSIIPKSLMSDIEQINAVKTVTISIPSFSTNYQDGSATVNDAVTHTIKGFNIEGSSGIAIMGCYFYSDTAIRVRVRNIAGGTISGASVTVKYA